MATIGQSLTAPETGWQRFDDADSNITYSGTGWTTYSNASNYNGGYHYTSTIGDSVKFNFTGTKLRIIIVRTTTVSTNMQIKIDGNIVESINGNGSLLYQCLIYEKTGLVNKEHCISITAMDTSVTILDAIDIDSTGTLKPYNANIDITKYLIRDKNNILYNVSGGYTDNLIPKMTSNTAPSGIVSANYYDSYYAPFYAFDRGESNRCWMPSGNSLSGWLAYEFSTSKTICKYTILGANTDRCPKSWTFEGSNDGTNFTILDTQTNITDWLDGVKKEFIFNNRTAYKKYRLNIISSTGTSFLGVSEVEMMEVLPDELTNLGQSLSDSLFINKGITDPTIVNNQTPTTRGIYGKDSGTLGSGKVFEFSLDSVLKSVKNIS